MNRVLAVLAVLAALAGPVHAQKAEVRSLPLSALAPSGAERTLDWRGWRSTVDFTLPAGLEAQNLRIVLSAVPGEAEPAPHASLSVTLNGSPPAILHPEPYPFTAQLDFPAQYLRDGQNVAEIVFLSPEGDCPNPGDGAWTLDLGGSHVELSAPPAAPASTAELEMLLASELLSPGLISIDTAGLEADAQASLQLWTAMALAVHMPAAPHFSVGGAAEADLAVAFDLRPDIDQAWLGFSPGPAPVLTVHAAGPRAAAEKLEAFAHAAEPEVQFPLPAFDAAWRPEPAEAAFTLDARPRRSTLILQAALSEHAAAGARMDIQLNGHPLRAGPARLDARRATIDLPAHLLQPGRNVLRFAPDLAPAEGAELCPAEGAAANLRIEAMRLNHRLEETAPAGLFGFAAGAFAEGGADIALPAAAPAEREAQLRLLAEIARGAGRPPEIRRVLTSVPAPSGQTPLVVLAARRTLPQSLLDRAPESFGLALRGPSSQDGRFRLGPRAFAAPPIPAIPVAGGAATRFSIAEENESNGATITILTEAAGADFPVTLNALVDQGLLAGFDGRVARWTANDVFVQDHGPWRSAGPAVPPPNMLELRRTLLFLALVGGLSLAWVLARRQRFRR